MPRRLLLLAAASLTITACADGALFEPTERPRIRPSAQTAGCPDGSIRIGELTGVPTGPLAVGAPITVSTTVYGMPAGSPVTFMWGDAIEETVNVASDGTVSATHVYEVDGSYLIFVAADCAYAMADVTVGNVDGEPSADDPQAGEPQDGEPQDGGQSTDPTNPTDPTAPTEPATPTEPAKPAEPTGPTSPTNPGAGSPESTTTPAPTPVSSAGCTRTQGYWKQAKHSWPGIYQRNAAFFSSGTSWQQLLNTAPSTWAAENGGEVYIQLGYQYIAATLNATRNGGAPAHVASAIDAAYGYFMGTALSRAESERLKNLLDRFNNGLEGVPHCR